MKELVAVIEQNEDSYFAYIEEIDGCVAGGKNYNEVKSNLDDILNLMIKEEEEIRQLLKHGYKIKFEVNLESVFDLIPEINISQLAKTVRMNPGLLRQYVSGTKRASERQTDKVMKAIQLLSNKLNSISLTT